MADGHISECALTNKNLVDISNNIGKGWESLAPYLNISQIEIDRIKEDYRQSMQLQIFHMLLIWRGAKGCNATLASLLDIMRNVRNVRIEWKALKDIFGPVVDNEFVYKKIDDRKPSNSQVPIAISQTGHIPGTSANVTQELLTVLQYDLINHYRELFRSLQISPLIEEDGFASSFFKLYVKPILKILHPQEPQGQSTPMRTLHDIFVRNPTCCTKIYISSQAGCGKTSFAKQLALIWCQAHLPTVSDKQWILQEEVDAMKKFKFMFFVFLRAEHEQECDVDSMILNQLLYNLANSKTYIDLGLKTLQDILNSEECIIILDGLDEWSHPLKKLCKLKNKHIPHIKARPLCTTLTTSRPWKLDVVRLNHADIDLKLELNGFEGDFLERLISKFITGMNELGGKNMKADDFKHELRDKKLNALNTIPILVMQLLTMWFDNEPFGKSQCEIYSNMFGFLRKRYLKKREVVELENIEVVDCHRELLKMLAKLAYHTLFTDNEETLLVFDRRIAEKYLTDPAIQMSLSIGILTQERVLDKMSIRQSRISFIHKTFQEYLGALYVTLNPGVATNVEEKIKHVCCSIEKILEMSQIFMFLSGLCPNVMVNLCTHLGQTVSKDNRTQRYRDSCELHPGLSSEGETLRRVQDTMEWCLCECWLNGRKDVTHLPVSDFFIWSPSEWSAELMSLIVHNHVRTLYVWGVGYSPDEIEGILNSITASNSMQKLWLRKISETFVVQLVSQHKHSLKIRPNTWRHLKFVTLEWVSNIPGDILCALVDSILQLPNIVNVRLWSCSILKETINCEEYITSHPRLTVVKEDEKDGRNVTLQFHTNSRCTSCICSTM